MSRRRNRAAAACLASTLMLMVGCSRVPPGGPGTSTVAGGFQQGGQEGTTGTGRAPGVSTTGTAGTGGFTAPGTGGSATGGNSANGSTGSGTGSTAGGTVSAGNGVSGPGIKGRTIHIVFHAKLNDCGPDPQSAQAGTLKAEALKTYADYVAFFNKYVLAQYGWKLTYDLIDDGGVYCPEIARAAALKIVKEIKPFATLGDSFNGDAGSVLADIVSSAKFLNIGLSWQTYDEFKKRNPYAWPIFGMAQQQDGYLAEWIGKRVKGTTTPDLTTGAQVARNFGLLTVDNPENHKLAALLRTNLASRGVTLAHEYYVSSDPGVAAQTSTNTVLKMKNDNVNTLIFAIPYTSLQSLLVHTSAMGNQNYTPDLLGSRYGVVFFDELFESKVWNKFRGVFNGVPALIRASGTNEKYMDINENGGAYKYAWTKMGNTDDADKPGNAPNVWQTLSTLALGIMNAGPVLNAQTFANGIDQTAHGKPAECGAWRLLGRPWTYGTYVSRDQTHEGAVFGYTPGYWVKKPNDFHTVGYYESYDSYKYFSGGDLPPKPTGDTGGTASPDIPKQKKIGLRADISCVKLGLRD
jgi:hypothetical protein